MKNIKKFFIIPLLSLATVASLSYTIEKTYVKADESEIKVPTEKNKEILEKFITAAKKTKSFEISQSVIGKVDGQEQKNMSQKILYRYDYKNYKFQNGNSMYFLDGKSYYKTIDDSWVVVNDTKTNKEIHFEKGIFKSSPLEGMFLNKENALKAEDIEITEKDNNYILNVKEETVKKMMDSGEKSTTPFTTDKASFKITVNKSTYVPKSLVSIMSGEEAGKNFEGTINIEFKEFDNSKPIELPKEAKNAKEINDSEFFDEYLTKSKLKYD